MPVSLADARVIVLVGVVLVLLLAVTALVGGRAPDTPHTTPAEFPTFATVAPSRARRRPVRCSAATPSWPRSPQRTASRCSTSCAQAAVRAGRRWHGRWRAGGGPHAFWIDWRNDPDVLATSMVEVARTLGLSAEKIAQAQRVPTIGVAHPVQPAQPFQRLRHHHKPCDGAEPVRHPGPAARGGTLRPCRATTSAALRAPPPSRSTVPWPPQATRRGAPTDTRTPSSCSARSPSAAGPPVAAPRCPPRPPEAAAAAGAAAAADGAPPYTTRPGPRTAGLWITDRGPALPSATRGGRAGPRPQSSARTEGLRR